MAVLFSAFCYICNFSFFCLQLTSLLYFSIIRLRALCEQGWLVSWTSNMHIIEPGVFDMERLCFGSVACFITLFLRSLWNSFTLTRIATCCMKYIWTYASVYTLLHGLVLKHILFMLMKYKFKYKDIIYVILQ